MLASDLGMTVNWWRADANITSLVVQAMLRLAIIIAALTIVAFSPALAKGGTIRRSEPVPMATTTGSLPRAPVLDSFGGCGHGRYRDPDTHRCRGPADIDN
jgi:hypothetical protein